MNIPLECANEDDSMEKLFVNEPVTIGYNIIKNSDFVNLNLEKDGYNKYFV